jgi:AraC-like DNA-binding protein
MTFSTSRSWKRCRSVSPSVVATRDAAPIPAAAHHGTLGDEHTMIEMQASGLTLVFAQVAQGEALRLAQARPALLLSLAPLALTRDDELPATASAVFAQLSAAGEVLAQPRVALATPLMILRTEDEALTGALYAARLIAGSIYVPPGVLAGLLNAARLAAAPGGLPQQTLLALISVLKGWIQSLPRLLRSGARDTASTRMLDLRVLRLVQRIELELGARLAGRIPLDQLAREVHSSQAQLTRSFRAVNDISIAQYRRELRLRVALHALLQEEPRCEQVARDVGYRSASQFSVDFRALFGVVPSRVVGLLGAEAVGVAPPRASTLRSAPAVRSASGA